MAQDSKIEWTHHTANLWHGCTKVHAGCDHCYAETLSHRWGNDLWGANKPRKEIKAVWRELKKYQRLAKEAGEIHRVFVGSMMDIFEKEMPLVNSKNEPILDEEGLQRTTAFLRQKLFNEIIPACPNLDFLLLTKRPSNINRFIPAIWKGTPPDNVLFGTSISDQHSADTLVPQLLQVRGRKFLSIEPQLSLIELKPTWLDKDRYFDAVGPFIHWVIVGGESGHHRRPFNEEWAKDILWSCRMYDVPFFMKQMDKVEPIPENLMIRQFYKPLIHKAHV